jgi:serine/threonine protein kinase
MARRTGEESGKKIREGLAAVHVVVSCSSSTHCILWARLHRYSIKEVIGKGSYGLVCSAIDNYTGEKVAIKKINNVFEHVSDATRILREIKLLRLLKHPGACTGAAWHCFSTTLSSMKR